MSSFGRPLPMNFWNIFIAMYSYIAIAGHEHLYWLRKFYWFINFDVQKCNDLLNNPKNKSKRQNCRTLLLYKSDKGFFQLFDHLEGPGEISIEDEFYILWKVNNIIYILVSKKMKIWTSIIAIFKETLICHFCLDFWLSLQFEWVTLILIKGRQLLWLVLLVFDI